ncbi:DUF2007 domain-containing protein [Fimbriiglobus ruber]|uniref:Uncharacterized protein n=1 Tax=Fimbriiglobus ruber TaxID=1908690 RepID=A0A225E1M8_9BACT|nr:DUF2007 domain-containing protein [Fimbriiglobus ruber]OWK47113.1 hypothetical protein FRUB_00812 [Fimbriiglobus ruber]
MTHNPDDVVMVAAGTLIQVQLWQQALKEAGIDSRVVGGELTGGIGTAFPDSVELWAHRSDAEKATAAVSRMEKEKEHTHRHEMTHPTEKHGHPVSDPKPDTSRGPTHGAPPHRPLP